MIDPAERVRRELAKLRPGTTICPGMLARRVLPGPTASVAALRPVLAELERRGEVRLLQRGRRVNLAEIRGPFRVAPGTGGQDGDQESREA